MPKRPIIKGFLLHAALCAVIVGQASSFDIVFGLGQPDIPDHLQSNGSTAIPIYAGYDFELGAFTDVAPGTPFIPTAANTDEWSTYWTPIQDSSGSSIPGGRQEYGEFPTLFSSAKGFNTSFVHDHSNAPFTEGRQMYVWGFDQRDAPGTAQWVLYTNAAEWKLNDGSNELSFSQTFHAGGATHVVVGSVTDGLVQLEDVVVSSGGMPTMSIADAESSEDGGVFSVMVMLSTASATDVTVECSMVSGSAVSEQDYSVTDGTITVPAGQLSVPIEVTLVNDPEAETDETFQVHLDSPSGAILVDTSALVTIRDDDALEALVKGGALHLDDSSGELTVGWPAVVGREYSVEFSHDLVDWQPLAGAESIVAVDSAEDFVLPSSDPRCFYRVVDLAPSAP